MSDIRANARIVAIASRLAQRGNRPAWIKPFDPISAFLTVQRYRIRQSSRTIVEPRSSESDYQRYLRSRDWYDFRLAIMALGGGACAKCDGVADEVHHLHYRTLGNESPCDVEPLCRECHAAEHPNAMKVSWSAGKRVF